MSSIALSRPTLIINTVYFDSEDRAEADRLGLRLYGDLTRPIDDPLQSGPGIPVYCSLRPENVDLEAAEIVVIIPILGTLAFQFNQDQTLQQIRNWHTRLGPEHVLPLPIDEVWRSVEDQLPGKQLLTELYESGDDDGITVHEIVHSVSRLLAAHQGEKDDVDKLKPALFISHAKADLEATGRAARRIANYTKTNTTGKAFFDRTELAAGKSLNEQIADAAGRGVFVAVRGDSYSSRIWCQQELLVAKQNGLPTLTIELLRRGEKRSSAYGGNGPTMVWDGDPAKVTAQAMIEWVRAAHFRHEARRLQQAVGLPKLDVLVRPPELLDLAQGPLRPFESQLVMHPDPELPIQERQVLRNVNPRLRFVTPLTVHRRVLSGEMDPSVDAPLDGIQVAMSLSDNPDVSGADGFTEHHVVDATTQLSRALVSTGAAIAYGGDFRKRGFTFLLVDLIKAYNQTAASPAESLHAYLAAPISLGSVPRNTPMRLHHMTDPRSTDMEGLAIIKEPPADNLPHRQALCYSDMRRVMAIKTDARVIVGGNAVPRLDRQPGDAGQPGYGGRFPGVVEEAWRSLQLRQPVYVIGGFGGGASLVADLLMDKPIPERLKDETWMVHEEFREKAKLIDDDPDRTKLRLPGSMDELAAEIKRLGLPWLGSDSASINWNGLTVAENQQLFSSRDPLVIVSLVMKGLLEQHQQSASGKLAIELVRGSVTAASNLDVIAVGTFEGIPLAGAGAAIDEAIGGLATATRSGGRQLVNVRGSSEIDANWIYLASMGSLDEGDIEEKIRDAARQTAKEVQRLGMRRLGIVAYGGNVISEKRLVPAMLDGLAELAGFATVSWFELSEQRFDDLNRLLTADRRVQLTTRRIESLSIRRPRDPGTLMIHVESREDGLAVTLLPPDGNALVGKNRRVVSRAVVDQFAVGSGTEQRRTPDLQTIETRGRELAKIVLGDHAEELLAKTSDARVVIVHDVDSSRLPFEMMSTSIGAPAVKTGMSRRLAIRDVAVDQLFPRAPKSEQFNVLLVINPTGDLKGAVIEGEAVAAILKSMENVKLKVLREHEATVAAVKQEFPYTDVLHYCGHAFFDGTGEHESGLILAGNSRLTLSEIRALEMPRVAFVNACEAARVRGQDNTANAASFAELFLRSGVEAFLGTFWRVGDSAAELFSKAVYGQLAAGERLDEAVTKARRDLKDKNERDWANYILYGDGRFQLIRDGGE